MTTLEKAAADADKTREKHQSETGLVERREKVKGAADDADVFTIGSPLGRFTYPATYFLVEDLVHVTVLIRGEWKHGAAKLGGLDASWLARDVARGLLR